MSAGKVSDYITKLEGYRQIEVELHLKGGQVNGITLVRQLYEKDKTIEIKDLTKLADSVDGSSWALNAVEGYSAYKITYKENVDKYGELPLSFQIKKDYDRALAFAGNQDNLKLKFDVYKRGDKYSIGNVRISGKYDLKDVPIYNFN